MLTNNSSITIITDNEQAVSSNKFALSHMVDNDYASNSKLIHDREESRIERFKRESEESVRPPLERSTSADMDKERHEISRFIKKYSLNSIPECDESVDLDEDGYMSDPTHIEKPSDF